jgi:hypothetical protein
MRAPLFILLSVMLAACDKSHEKTTQPASLPQPGPPQNGTEKLPLSSAASTPESIPKEIFPEAPKTVRKVDCFRSFVVGTSMYAVVQKCGRPDRELGSGIGYFVYDLDDGTFVSIRWTDINHVIDIRHSDKSGKSSSLLATK